MSVLRDAEFLAKRSALIERWRAAWPQAVAVWSKFTRLRDARLCESRVEAAQEGLSGSFAMIRLADQSVVVDLETVHSLGLDDYYKACVTGGPMSFVIPIHEVGEFESAIRAS